MISILSLVTSAKDYVEIVHKLIESDASYKISNYFDIGPIITYIVICLKEFVISLISFNWIKNIWDFPIIIPDISSAMISEISVLDGFFHNSFNFLDRPISYGETNLVIYNLEKFSIGLINSFFLFLPTSTAHLITLRRFVVQGLEAGYLAGLGSIAGNILWIASIIFGWRFFVIPWISLDIFRYLLGFVLLVKYMWDSYNEKKLSFTNSSEKQKIFLLNFLLALTEQTNIYPFISNLSISSESSILESFPANSYLEFLSIHGFYILGLTLGSLSLLHLTCWFWENPAFKLYMWVIASPQFKGNSSFYYKLVNFSFLYLTMISAISSIPYYGLDYTLNNPLGFVQDDRVLDQKLLLESSFLNSKASDRNTRRNRGRHGRRERWKRRIRKYRTFDASLYDQGIYDLFTIEDLNYGFDRFWLRRKMRNHRVRFRFFPGGWMRSFKKQLAKPRLESYKGPRQEFFRILFEQVYHPSFHEYKMSENFKGKNKNQDLKKNLNKEGQENLITSSLILNSKTIPLSSLPSPSKTRGFFGTGQSEEKRSNFNSFSGMEKNSNKLENSVLRKFYRKTNKRINTLEVQTSLEGKKESSLFASNNSSQDLYSKRWKSIFSRISQDKNGINSSQTLNKQLKSLFQNFYQKSLLENSKKVPENPLLKSLEPLNLEKMNGTSNTKKNNSKLILSNQEKQILKYKSLIFNKMKDKSGENSLTLLHPLKFYLEKQNRYEKKLNYYTPSIFRKFSVENNAPYFRTMMNRYFYYYKPTLRWERTMKVGSLRKARRKTSTHPRKIQLNSDLASPKTKEMNLAPFSKELMDDSLSLEKIESANNQDRNISNRLAGTTHNYSIVGKKATRYRYQIYKDVLQHWYYSPFNRLLLKFDIDLFINRQPNSHFLTKEEENVLHLRRYLLSEHYNSLRWYSYMQHYRSMKTKIGGTKSFASRTYNQQFSGTFKKIRHLFAITPSQGNEPILKFDQILYNDKYNSSSNNSQKNLFIHEDLLFNQNKTNYLEGIGNESISYLDGNSNLLNNSMLIMRDYLIKTNPVKQNYIKQLIEEKNSIELIKFLYKGQKTRGVKPITNQKSLLAQEKEYLLTTQEKEELKKLEKLKIEKFLYPLQQDLWINLLKKWKRKGNDQEFLKNYLQRRVEKHKKTTLKKEKILQTKLNRLETSFPLNSPNFNNYSESQVMNSLAPEKTVQGFDPQQTTGVKKAIMDGIYVLKDEKQNLMKTSERQNFKNTLSWETKSNIVSNLNPSVNQQNFGSNKLLFKNMSDSILIKKEKELIYSLKNISSLIRKSVKKNQSVRETKLIKKSLLRAINFKEMSFKFSSFIGKFKKTYRNLLSIRLKNLFRKFHERNLKKWQKSERSSNKQKRSRKEFKLFSKKPFKNESKNYQNYLEPELILNSQDLQNKRYLNESSLNMREPQRESLSRLLNSSITKKGSLREKRENELTRKKRDNLGEAEKNSWKKILKETYMNYFSKNFKRKKSPQRRSRVSRNRGVTRKRTLSDSLKRQFKNLKRYGEKMDNKKEQIYLNLNSNKELNTNGLFTKNPLQRRSKQKKQRFWKQKRPKYSQKLRKYRKRRRSVLGKIRILNKQLKKIKITMELKNWWWKDFLPNLRATTDSLWQYEKDRQIQQKLAELSIPNLLEREKFRNLSNKGTALLASQAEGYALQGFAKDPNLEMLQIGDYDYKPLGMPQTLQMINQFSSSNKLNQQNSTSYLQTEELSSQVTKTLAPQNKPGQKIAGGENSSVKNEKSAEKILLNTDILTKLSQKTLINETEFKNLKNKIVPTTNLPFYAGWDESLRKFVVTNRLLSRRESGYSSSLSKDRENSKTSLSNLNKNLEDNNVEKNLISFEKAPLNGMNAATTLYWQIPFTTYDPEQFFALGMDGFAPLGWRRFQFRHSLLKSWLYEKTISKLEPSQQFQTLKSKNNLIVKTKTNIINSDKNDPLSKQSRFNLDKPLLYKLTEKLNPLVRNNVNLNPKFSNPSFKNIYRRVKKRYRRVKKHPRSPSWFPSGPLLTQVLPVHYIYIFYKRSRLPRDRYIKRRLQKYKENNPLLSNVNKNNIPEFTLRKRIKTKRKYHLKQNLTKKSLLIPRRVKFITNEENITRWRPLSRQKVNKSIVELIKEQRALKYKQRKKDENLPNNKQSSNIRVKQLRRRVQRQILRSVWRYKPRAGGFVWPGDYLKLELIKTPKLKLNSEDSKNQQENGKQKRKKKRNIPESQIQSKKYLLKKHNSNAIKKKLEKAQRSNKISQRIKELNFLI